MLKPVIISLVAILCALAVACIARAEGPAGPPQKNKQQPAPAHHAAPGNSLTLHQIENGTLKIPPMTGDDPDSLIKLTNGVYKNGPETVAIETQAFGDLNGDGKGDAAVVYYENGGGTGYFKNLTVFLNKGGKPEAVEPKVLGDRVGIRKLQIKSGVIVLDVLSHGPTDGACCPTVKKTARYHIEKGQLVGPESLYE